MKLLLRYVLHKIKHKKSCIKSYYVSRDVKIGHHVTINKDVIIGKNVCIDSYSYVNDSSIIINANIGSFTSISYNCMIGLPEHPINYISTSPFFYSKSNLFSNSETFNGNKNKTIIGNDVWIGVNSVIMSGIKIGDGVIIGAGSIVTKDVPDYAIVVGSPAKIIRYRFDEKVIEFLLDYKYWDNFEFKKSDILKYQRAGEEWIKVLNEIKD